MRGCPPSKEGPADIVLCPLERNSCNLLVASVSSAGYFFEWFFFSPTQERILENWVPWCVNWEPDHRLEVTGDGLGFTGGLSLHEADSVDGWDEGRA